jgi:hypothetical protein
MPEIQNKEAIIETVLLGVADGKPLRQLCRDHGIGKSTWYDWMEDDEVLAGRFARARLEGFDAIAEEALRIADTPIEGEIVTVDGEKVTKRTEDMLGHRKLQVETRLKLLAKWDPKRYGDKQLLGNDPDNPLPNGIAVTFTKPSA